MRGYRTRVISLGLAGVAAFAAGVGLSAESPAVKRIPNAHGRLTPAVGLQLDRSVQQAFKRQLPPPPKPNGGPAAQLPSCFVVSGSQYSSNCNNDGKAVSTSAQLIFISALNTPNLKELHLFVQGSGTCTVYDGASGFSAPVKLYPTPDQADLNYVVKGPPGLPFYTYVVYFIFDPATLKAFKNQSCSLFANNKQLKGTIDVSGMSGTVTATMKDGTKKSVPFSLKVS